MVSSNAPTRCPARSRQVVAWIAASLAIASFVSSGCSTLKLPALPINPLAGRPSDGLPAGMTPVEGTGGQGSVLEQVYYAVRQAKSKNSIVLHVVSDSTPVRVLPLPQAKSVYVSQLLRDTGVAKKIGSIEATLYRHSTDSINGLPMKVKIASDGKSVKPESDYALQPGDRLLVRKADNPALQSLVNMVLGRK